MPCDKPPENIDCNTPFSPNQIESTIAGKIDISEAEGISLRKNRNNDH